MEYGHTYIWYNKIVSCCSTCYNMPFQRNRFEQCHSRWCLHSPLMGPKTFTFGNTALLSTNWTELNWGFKGNNVRWRFWSEKMWSLYCCKFGTGHHTSQLPHGLTYYCRKYNYVRGSKKAVKCEAREGWVCDLVHRSSRDCGLPMAIQALPTHGWMSSAWVSVPSRW